MNIFYLDHRPKLCAIYHCDKHVNKMITEHLQMMSVALDHYGLEPAKRKNGEYYSTKAYKNHPCTLWVKESSDNFLWLWQLTRQLCMEFKRRYGKSHAGENSIVSILPSVTRLMQEDIFPHVGHTPPAQAMPDYCKCPGDAVTAYRTYYNLTKWEFAVWNRGNDPQPSWWAPGCYLNAEGGK